MDIQAKDMSSRQEHSIDIPQAEVTVKKKQTRITWKFLEGLSSESNSILFDSKTIGCKDNYKD